MNPKIVIVTIMPSFIEDCYY